MGVFGEDDYDYPVPSKCRGCGWFDGTCKYYLFNDGDDELPCED